MRISDWSSDVCSSDLLSEPSQFNLAEHLALECLVLKKRSRHRSFNEGWSDGIDANLVGGEVKRHCLAEAFDCPFGRTIERPAGTPDMPHLGRHRSEEHTSELQSLMRNSYAVFCLKKKK